MNAIWGSPHPPIYYAEEVRDPEKWQIRITRMLNGKIRERWIGVDREDFRRVNIGDYWGTPPTPEAE